MLPCLKRCSTKLPLRAGLIRTAKIHKYLISYVVRAYKQVLHYSALNRVTAVKTHNGIMFHICGHYNYFVSGKPHTCLWPIIYTGYKLILVRAMGIIRYCGTCGDVPFTGV